MSLDRVTDHGGSSRFLLLLLPAGLDPDCLPQDVREGHLPPDVGEGRSCPCDHPRDKEGLSRLPYGKRDRRAEFLNEAYPLFSVGLLAPTELHCLDAHCGTVVPSQVFLSQMEVWRHTEVGYVRNRTLEGQR